MPCGMASKLRSEVKCKLFQSEYLSTSLAEQTCTRPVTCPMNSAKSQLSSGLDSQPGHSWHCGWIIFVGCGENVLCRLGCVASFLAFTYQLPPQVRTTKMLHINSKKSVDTSRRNKWLWRAWKGLEGGWLWTIILNDAVIYIYIYLNAQNNISHMFGQSPGPQPPILVEVPEQWKQWEHLYPRSCTSHIFWILSHFPSTVGWIWGYGGLAVILCLLFKGPENLWILVSLGAPKTGLPPSPGATVFGLSSLILGSWLTSENGEALVIHSKPISITSGVC